MSEREILRNVFQGKILGSIIDAQYQYAPDFAFLASWPLSHHFFGNASPAAKSTSEKANLVGTSGGYVWIMHCNWGIFSWTHSLSQQFLGFLSAWCQWNLWPMRKLVSHSYVLISLLQDHSFEIWAYYYGQHLVSSWINMLFIWMKFLTITWQLICVNKSDAHLFWNVFIILNFKAKHLHGDELFFLPFIQSSAAPEASPERAEESFCYTYSIARQEVCRN